MYKLQFRVFTFGTHDAFTSLRLSKVLHPTRHKIGHFGDVLPSQSLGLVLKKAKPNETNLDKTKPK